MHAPPKAAMRSAPNIRRDCSTGEARPPNPILPQQPLRLAKHRSSTRKTRQQESKMRRVTTGLCITFMLLGGQAAPADDDYDHGYQSYQRYGSQPESSNGIAGYNAARDYERQQQMQRDDDARRQQMMRETPPPTPSGRYQPPRSQVSSPPLKQSPRVKTVPKLVPITI
jgi:hypothetical protein